MPMIPDADQQAIREHLEKELNGDVRLVLFTQAPRVVEVPGAGPDIAGEMSTHTRTLMGEIAALSDRITLEEHDAGSDEATTYGVDKAPAIALVGAQDYGVRYFGMPSGHDAAAFLADIIDVGNGATQLSEATREALAKLEHDVHLQVFVTPT